MKAFLARGKIEIVIKTKAVVDVITQYLIILGPLFGLINNLKIIYKLTQIKS